MKHTLYKPIFLFFLISAAGSPAQAATYSPHPSSMDNPLAIILVVVASALLLAIGMMSYVLINVAKMYYERLRQQKQNNSPAATIIILLTLCFLSSPVWAQNTASADETTTSSSAMNFGGLSPFAFYALMGVIVLEVIIILAMAWYVKIFTQKEKRLPATQLVHTEKPAVTWKKFWQKINNFRPQNEESAILLDHSYDGIRELDNSLPGWWVWGFAFSIVFGFTYLFRYHVAHSAPLSAEELQISLQQAEEQKERYLATAASKVDETTVTIMDDPATLSAGQNLFTSNCAPCHGNLGQGIVGPNLTDDYWLHGGSIHDVFTTIKYGYAEKGMKSWKDDFSPMQIAQLANFVKSIHGTNPANAKEPQGELYKDEAAPAKDSANLPEEKIEEVNTKSEEAGL